MSVVGEFLYILERGADYGAFLMSVVRENQPPYMLQMNWTTGYTQEDISCPTLSAISEPVNQWLLLQLL